MHQYTAITCTCGEDIDKHLIRYDEQRDTYSSGPCMDKKCPCKELRLAYPNEVLNAGQLQRLTSPFGGAKIS